MRPVAALLAIFLASCSTDPISVQSGGYGWSIAYFSTPGGEEYLSITATHELSKERSDLNSQAAIEAARVFLRNVGDTCTAASATEATRHSIADPPGWNVTLKCP
jgi:hypothetical protein